MSIGGFLWNLNVARNFLFTRRISSSGQFSNSSARVDLPKQSRLAGQVTFWFHNICNGIFCLFVMILFEDSSHFS